MSVIKIVGRPVRKRKPLLPGCAARTPHCRHAETAGEGVADTADWTSVAKTGQSLGLPPKGQEERRNLIQISFILFLFCK